MKKIFTYRIGTRSWMIDPAERFRRMAVRRQRADFPLWRSLFMDLREGPDGERGPANYAEGNGVKPEAGPGQGR